MREEPAGFPTSSLATRCPDCATVFRVVPDQLRLSEGWVRCGHCAAVFDASRNLVDLDQLPIEPTAGAVSPTASVQEFGTANDADLFPSIGQEHLSTLHVRSSVDAAQPGLTSTSYRGRSVAARQILHGENIADATTVEPASDPGKLLIVDPNLALQVQQRQTDAGRGNPQVLTIEALAPVDGRQPDAMMSPGLHSSDAVSSHDDQAGEPHLTSVVALSGEPPSRLRESDIESLLSQEPKWTGAPQDESGAAAEIPRLSDVGFIRLADHSAFWKQPWAVAMLLLSCGLLTVMLAMQMVAHQRDQVVAALPFAEAPIAALCRLVPCDPSPRRQIESVLIESSAFNRRGDHYLLSVDLRNSAKVPLGMPALELTLTDLQDRVVVRRVLLPNALDAPMQIDPSGLWSGRIAVRVANVAGSSDYAAVAGYRLLAFYP